MNLSKIWKMFGIAFFAYLFVGFMVLPCLNTLKQIFTVTNAEGKIDPFMVIRFFFAGSMPSYVLNSLKLAVFLVVTVNIVGISIVLLTEYFDIKGAKILRLGYMTTLIYSGVALVTGYQFLYDKDGMLTVWLAKIFPGMDRYWFSGFYAVLFTMTFACTSNHALFLRNAIRSIDYNTVEAARNMGAKPFKVLWKVVLPTLIPTLFSLTVMTFITGLCAMSAPTLLGYDSINPEIVRLAGSSAADESFPQARAALLSIILALFTILLLTVLSAYERKGHYLSVSKTKAKLVKQKITNPAANVLAHIYAYVLFVIYMTPVVMIVIFAFQNYPAIRSKVIDFGGWTLINFFGSKDYEFMTNRGKTKLREGAISGLFANADTVGGIRLSFVLSAIAAALACVIVVVAVNYIFKNKNKKRSVALEYSLLFPWLLPTILICYSYRVYFNTKAAPSIRFGFVLLFVVIMVALACVIVATAAKGEQKTRPGMRFAFAGGWLLAAIGVYAAYALWLSGSAICGLVSAGFLSAAVIALVYMGIYELCALLFKKQSKLTDAAKVLAIGVLCTYALGSILGITFKLIKQNAVELPAVVNILISAPTDVINELSSVNLYMRENVRFLIIMAYTVVKLPFALRMIKAAFYAIDDELEDAARNLGASQIVTFLRVKLPIVLPSVLAVFALNFNALFTEYDMSATFHSSYGKSYAMIIQNMCTEEGRDGYNMNASGRRCASTVFIMLVSGLILYLVYGVGARDLAERLERREKRKKKLQAALVKAKTLVKGKKAEA